MKQSILLLGLILACSMGYATTTECPQTNKPTPMSVLPCSVTEDGGSGSIMLQTPGSSSALSSFSLTLMADTNNTAPTSIGLEYQNDCSATNPLGTTNTIYPININPGWSTSVDIQTNCTFAYVEQNLGLAYSAVGGVTIYQAADASNPSEARVFTIIHN